MKHQLLLFLLVMTNCSLLADERAKDTQRIRLGNVSVTMSITTVPVYGGIECTKGGGQKNLTADEYRRAITLDPPTARPDSVVLIVLNTRALGRPYGHIHSDGSDLRLTEPDGKATLRYWIEHWDPHGDSRIWVRVPQQGTDRLWLCYGKARARATSDGAAVFDFFDDFNDGLWTKHPEPVIQGFYGGDPYLAKIAGAYYAWCSRAHKGHLRIYCLTSPDMIHWHGLEHRPQLGYSQPWERGIGRPEVSWDRHLADADLVEHRGKVLMYYGGAQSPFGAAVFDGTMAQLATRIRLPLGRWAPSHYGCVEGRELKISDNETDTEPLRPLAPKLSDRGKYVVEYRVRCEAGYCQKPAATNPEGWSAPTRCVPAVSHRATAVIRYGDAKTFARLWAKDNDTTYYEECLNGVWRTPVNIGANRACDDEWHRWRIEVVGPENRLSIDGRRIGTCRASASLCNRSDLAVGFSTYDTFAAWDDVRVQRAGLVEPAVQIGAEERIAGR